MAVGREPCCHCEAFASQKSDLVGEKGLKGAGVEKPSPCLSSLEQVSEDVSASRP